MYERSLTTATTRLEYETRKVCTVCCVAVRGTSAAPGAEKARSCAGRLSASKRREIGGIAQRRQTNYDDQIAPKHGGIFKDRQRRRGRER